MRRHRLVCLVALSLLLAGCLWVSPNNGLTTIDLKGEIAHSHELLLTRENRTYRLDLGQSTVTTLSLETGTWQIQACARDAAGQVVSLSEQSSVRGQRQAVAALILVKTEQATTDLRPQNVRHSWLVAGGITIRWDELDLEEGNWEVWKRHLSSPLWQEAGVLAVQETFFEDPDQKAREHLYAVRYGPPVADELFASPLVGSSGSNLGRLDLTWDVRHEYPLLRSTIHTSSLDRLEADHAERDFADLVAHFRTEHDFERREELLAGLGLVLKGTIPSLLVARVEPRDDSKLSLATWSTYQDAHLYLEPNWIVQASSSGMEGASLPWYLEYIRIPAAHLRTLGDQSVNIAIVDSGLDQDRAGQILPPGVKVVAGYNFVDHNADTSDVHRDRHGTTIAIAISEAMPVVSLQPVKVLGTLGGSDYDVSDGILYAAGLHSMANPYRADIINLSLGQEDLSDVLWRAVERVARETDVLMIAAAGNKGGTSLLYPAAYPQVLAVGTVVPGPNGPERAPYSQRGKDLDLVAPPTTIPGTSLSTALVSGVAGLMLAQGIPANELRSILAASAMDIGEPGWDEEYGHGLVHAQWAVSEITALTLTLRDAQGESVQEVVPLQEIGKSFYLPPGEYTVEAWVNVQGGSVPAAGDYTSGLITSTVLEDGETQEHVTLREHGDGL
ncbi:MAG: S8 family serine peptidase [Limnochordia bacterium]|nr:S8 family serine peptidase [Limnochordia bacterium]